MLRTSPERVYATTDILDSPQARERTERMIAATDARSVEWVTMAELDEVAATGCWDKWTYWGEMAEKRDPDLVFTTGKFLSDDEAQRLKERYPHLAPRDLWGLRVLNRREHGDADYRADQKGIVCQSAYELATLYGCPFRCAYCPLGTVNRILVNIEEYVEHLDDVFRRAPGQRLYKWDNKSDVPCFEPEYDASRPLVERFAREPERYLEIYVGKSAQTDYLLGYDHRGHTILQWSVCGPGQQQAFEERTDCMVDRLEAARRCQDAGYIVRFRLSPVLPTKNWREENRLLIEEMFARTRPDVVTLCPFGWNDLEDAERQVDFGLLDEEFVAAMRGAAPFLRQRGYTHGGARPIPHDARYVLLEFLADEVRRVSPRTPIALCLETEEMWTALGPRIGQSPGRFICNCGAHCTPGDRLYDATVSAG